jgi:GTPase SAR1 family protein
VRTDRRCSRQVPELDVNRLLVGENGDDKDEGWEDEEEEEKEDDEGEEDEEEREPLWTGPLTQ